MKSFRHSFSELFKDQAGQQDSSVYLDDTDRPLPEKIDVRTRYIFLKTIAKGGKSVIKACKDLHLSRVVCYKALRPELADDPIEQQRLLREARVSAMLQHPNTIPTYELGRDIRGHYYFTMKLVHGYTLREILDFRDRYDLGQLIEVAVQVAHALEYAHGHGVVHRDIKPENILIGPYGETLLLDWGLAKVWSESAAGASLKETTANEQSLTAVELAGPDLKKAFDENNLTGQGQLQGSVCYMSPEQVQRSPDIDARTDLYSVGAVLYEILCGQTPVDGNTMDQIVAAVLANDIPKPSTVSTIAIPALLEDICMRCLAYSPDARIATAQQLIRELNEDWRV